MTNSTMGQRALARLLRKVRDEWPSCMDIRVQQGEWQCAIETVTGNKHWVWLEVVPLAAAMIIDPVAATTVSERVKAYRHKNQLLGEGPRGNK